MDEGLKVFDRAQVRRQRDRAAARFREHDFLFQEVADRLLSRLDDIRRKFPSVLDLGCHSGLAAARLRSDTAPDRLVQCDLSPAMIKAAVGSGVQALAADEEALPFAPGSFDLVVSLLSLHWVNDLPGTLLQIRQILKPDGLLLAAFIGGDSLKELRSAMMQAELELESGASPRVSPFADIRDAGALLQRAGFALPVADLDTLTVRYSEPLKLLRDLRGMGETNAVLDRRKDLTRRATLLKALSLYDEMYRQPDGRVPATFDIVYLTGWAPDASQPLPLAPGSAKARLSSALDVDERSAGEKAGPPEGHGKP